MKIAPRAAEAFLAAPEKQCRAVLLYGPDSGLARERAERVRRTVLGENSDPFATVELDSNRLLDDPARLCDEILAISMLAPKRLIIIRGASDKLTRILEEAAPHFHDAAFLVVMAEELGTGSSLRLWFERESAAAALACYRDEARDVISLVRQAFGAAGITADRDVAEYLASQLGSDRYVTRQEIEKIVVFAGDCRTLSLEEVRSLVDYNRDTGLDDVVQAVADRDLGALEAMLQQQLREGTTPVAWIRALMRYFNRLYFIRAQMKQGRSLDEVVANLKPKVFFKQEQPLKRHAQNWNTEQIAKALMLLIKAELACKTSDLPPVPASGRRLFQMTQIR